MNLRKISSASNDLLKLIRKLSVKAERRQSGLFLLEGRKLINDALRQRIEVVDVVVSQSFVETELERDGLEGIDTLSVVSDALFKDLYTTTTSCGILATAVQPRWSVSDCFRIENPLLVVGEAIQDPGNLGTIIRNAFAFGADGMIVSTGSVDCFSPKVVRSSMGAIFNLVVVQELEFTECVRVLREHGVRIVALDAAGRVPYWEEPAVHSCAFVFGNEGNGLSTYAKEAVDALVKIPIQDSCESLNVAVAVGIVLADAFRHRTQSRTLPR